MTPAPFGLRFVAYAVDLVIVTVLMTVASFFLGLAAAPLLTKLGSPLALLQSPPAGGDDLMGGINPQLLNQLLSGGSDLILQLLAFLLAFCLVLGLIYHGYFVWYEARREGQTPGKRWCGLRVVSDDENGGPLTRKQAISRDMMRYIDVGLLIPGIVAIALDYPKARRLGDRLARTRVIRSSVKEFTPTKNIAVH